MIATLVFILGVLFGSFYNVVIYRVPLEKSIVRGRSMCPSCGHTLAPLELIPILSIIIQRFKCKHCHAPVSPRYLIVELLTGIGWLLVYVTVGNQGIFALISGCLLVSLTIIVAYIDYDTHYIADAVLAAFWIPRIVIMALAGESYIAMFWSLVTGAGIYTIIYIAARLYYKKEAFGMGDIMYIGVLAAWFNAADILIVALGSFFVAGVILLIVSLFKKFKRQQEIPFGPAISIMAMIMYYWGEILKEVYMQWIF